MYNEAIQSQGLLVDYYIVIIMFIAIVIMSSETLLGMIKLNEFWWVILW